MPHLLPPNSLKNAVVSKGNSPA